MVDLDIRTFQRCGEVHRENVYSRIPSMRIAVTISRGALYQGLLPSEQGDNFVGSRLSGPPILCPKPR